MSPETTQEELDAALETSAAEVLWEAGIEGPPIDGFLLAERLGLFVAQSDGLASRGRYASLGSSRGGASGAVVLVSADDRPERRHWAVAHEVGEATAHRVFERLGLTPSETPSSARESVANGLAARLLLPRRWFLPDARATDWDLPQLKSIYRTASHELIARRVLDLIGQPTVVTVFDHGRQTWRRASGGSPRPPVEPAEYEVWRRCHESAEKAEAVSLGAEYARARCWPVHEPGWKREVLMTELAECC